MLTVVSGFGQQRVLHRSEPQTDIPSTMSKNRMRYINIRYMTVNLEQGVVMIGWI